MYTTNDFIGDLARALYTYKVQICCSTLDKILHDKCSSPYRNRVDMEGVIAAAYDYWEQRDPGTAIAIAYAFTGAQGEDGACMASAMPKADEQPATLLPSVANSVLS